MTIKCPGCGVLLQSINKDEPGFVRDDILNRHDETIYCHRCFSLQHYNTDPQEINTSYDHFDLLTKLSNTGELVVYVLDGFSLQFSFLDEYIPLLNKLNLLIVVNKYDLMKNIISKEKYLMYLHKMCKDKGLSFLDTLIISSNYSRDIALLIDKILEYSHQKDVYLFGASNVGKSNIINNILNFNNSEIKKVTVSNLLQTTLGAIKIPFQDNYIIDTPGIVLVDQFPVYLNKQSLEKITPKKPLKPKVFQLNIKQSLIINGFAIVKFYNKINISVITYFENNLLIHRTKLANSETFFKKHHGDLLDLPTQAERERLGKLQTHTFVIEKDADIVIGGLGFITVVGTTTVDVITYEDISVNKVDVLI